MGYGTWISQFNVRSIATPFKDETQSGAPNGEKAVFQAQMLLNPGYSKNYFGKAAEHLKLVVEAYESEKQAPGKQVSGVYSKTLWNVNLRMLYMIYQLLKHSFLRSMIRYCVYICCHS